MSASGRWQDGLRRPLAGHTGRYRWEPITGDDIVRAESMAVQTLPPAIAVAVLAYLRVHAKVEAERTDPRSELSRLIRDLRWLALGELPG